MPRGEGGGGGGIVFRVCSASEHADGIGMVETDGDEYVDRHRISGISGGSRI